MAISRREIVTGAVATTMLPLGALATGASSAATPRPRRIRASATARPSRWTEWNLPEAEVSPGWTLERLTRPSLFYGANGITFSNGEFFVGQVYANRISAVDLQGRARTVLPPGGDVVGPDDLVFDNQGNLFITDFRLGRVWKRLPGGGVELFADDLPGANPIAWHQGTLYVGECRPGGRLLKFAGGGHAPIVLASDLKVPNAMGFGRDGKLYFPQLMAGEVWRIERDGSKLERVAEGLHHPTAAKPGPDGAIYILEAGSGNVRRLDVETRAMRTIATLDGGLDNLTFDARGRLFVSSFSRGSICEVRADGSVTYLVEPGFSGPLGVCAGASGEILVADYLSIAQVSADGRIRTVSNVAAPGSPGRTRGIAEAPDGTLIVTTTTDDVIAYDPGSSTSQRRAAKLEGPVGIACRGSDLIVAEARSGKVSMIDTAGKVTPLMSGLKQPMGVALAGNAVIATDSATGKVVLATGGGRPETLTGDLRNPQGVAVIGSRAYVVDAGSRSLIEIDLQSRRTLVIARNLPIGAPPGRQRNTAGQYEPDFAGLAATPTGDLIMAANGEGSIIRLNHRR